MKRSAISALVNPLSTNKTSVYYTSCRFCNVGCGYRVISGAMITPQSPDLPIVKLENGKYVEVVPDFRCPVNSGDYSVRGAFLTETLYNPRGPTSDRLVYPMIRTNGRLLRSSWDDALDHVANRLKSYIQKGGAESVGIYHADWFGGENAFAYMRLAQVLGTRNYDLNGRLCAASGAAGLTRSLGNGSHPWSIDDIDHAEAIVLAGANASATLSVVYDKIYSHAQQGAKLIVVDVRRTLAARNAEKYGVFLQINPGTDVALYNAMAHVLIKEDLVDKNYISAHVAGFGDFENHVLSNYQPEMVQRLIGVPADRIRQTAMIIGRSKPTLLLSGKGLEHQAHGTDMICSIINLALITGNMGRPGGSYSPLGGHQGSIVNPPLFAGQLGHITIPNRTIFEMLDQIDKGTQKALLCACVQPMVSLPQLNRVKEILSKKLEFLVVTDIYPNETTDLADVVFPAASWGEACFTSTNTDRRARFYELFSPPPGEARPDWVVPTEIGRRMGYTSHFPWNTSEEIFDELKRDTPFAGLSYARMRASGASDFQMPVPTSASIGTARLYVNGKFPTPDKKALLWSLDYKPQPEPPTAEYPFTLVTGRENDLWQSGYTFRRVPEQVARSPHNEMLVNTGDAQRLGIHTGKTIRVRTRRGTINIIARVTNDVPRGVLFTLWGYPDSRTNILTIDARDRTSQTPSYKACAASVSAL